MLQTAKPNRIDRAAGQAGWLVSLAGSGAGHGAANPVVGLAGWLVSLAGSGAGHGVPPFRPSPLTHPITYIPQTESPGPVFFYAQFLIPATKIRNTQYTIHKEDHYVLPEVP